MATKSDPNQTAGFALAAFLLSLSTLAERVKNGESTIAETSQIIGRARLLAEQSGAFPGDPKALQFAVHVLGLAETMIAAAAAEKPQSGSH
jgi:hypothetical protein